MFVGHYAAALAAKTAEPRAPLWTYVGACQLLDIAWGALVIGGIEKARVDPQMAGNGLDLYFMPYTHSLPASIAWSVATGLLARWLLKVPWRAAVVIGLAVLSHWVLDAIVHHQDMLLWPGTPKIGLGLWNVPVAEMALEMGLVAVAATAWMGRRRDEGGRIWPAALFIAFLSTIQVASALSPPPTDVISTGRLALILYILITAVAWALDRRPASSRRTA